MQKTITRVSLALVGLGVVVSGTAVLRRSGSRVISDTEADIWPDPRARQADAFAAVRTRLRLYASDHDSLPLSLEGVIPSAGRADHWGTPVRYARAGFTFTVRSAGADRQFDTEDDVTLTAAVDTGYRAFDRAHAP